MEELPRERRINIEIIDDLGFDLFINGQKVEGIKAVNYNGPTERYRELFPKKALEHDQDYGKDNWYCIDTGCALAVHLKDNPS